MNQHRIYKIETVGTPEYKWLQGFLKFLLFIKHGYYNGSGNNGWSNWLRIKCWFGGHKLREYYYIDVLGKDYGITIPCLKCGYNLVFRIMNESDKEFFKIDKSDLGVNDLDRLEKVHD